MKYKGLDIHHTSSLPSILDKYVSTGCIKQDTNKRQLKKQSLVGEEDLYEEAFLVSPHGDLEEETGIQQKTALEQRHLEVYRNMHLLQGVMQRRYAALLMQKVSKQRLEIKQREPPSPKPPENSREQGQSAAAGRRLPYCTLSHDDTYLKCLPKTGYYLIVELQNQLAQHGCLKTKQDQERFWSLVGKSRKKVRLESRLREIHEMMIGGRSAPDLGSERFTQKKSLGPAPTIQITVHGESHQEQAVPSEGAGQRLQGKRPQERAEIEQMFPKITLPKFATLQPGFLEQFKPGTISQLDICEPRQSTRTMTTELNVQKLRLMHSRSLANMAATKRLLDGNRISQYWGEENKVRSLMQYVFPTDDSRVKQRCTGKRFLPSLPPKIALKETAPAPQHNTAPPTRINTPELMPTEAQLVAPKPPDPLTLEEVSQQHDVMVIDRLCKTWTNYVGNSNMTESLPALETTTTMTRKSTTTTRAEKSENLPSSENLDSVRVGTIKGP